MNRKTITRILIAAVVLIALWNIFLTSESQQSYKTETLQKGSIAQSIDFTANWYPVGYAKVALGNFQDIRTIGVKEGNTVKAGQVIAQLNDDLEVAQYNTAKTSYYSAINNKNAAETAAKNSPMGITDSTKVTLTQLQGGINTAYRQMKAAEVSVNKKKVRAPIKGKVVAIVYEDFGIAGSALTSSMTGSVSGSNYLIIANESDVRLATTFSEQDVSQLNKNMRIEVTTRISDAVYTGKVLYISGVPVTQLASTTEEPSYKVIFALDKYLAGVPYGARLEGAVKIAEKADAQYLSYDAVTLNSSDKGTVLVKDGEGTKEKSVSIGIVADETIEITSGLENNEEVVVDVLPAKNVLTFRPWIKKIFNK